eukprot:614640-Alexandrium_andersonii.AAC.1
MPPSHTRYGGAMQVRLTHMVVCPKRLFRIFHLCAIGLLAVGSVACSARAELCAHFFRSTAADAAMDDFDALDAAEDDEAPQPKGKAKRSAKAKSKSAASRAATATTNTCFASGCQHRKKANSAFCAEHRKDAEAIRYQARNADPPETET